jgi:hypothetical protein
MKFKKINKLLAALVVSSLVSVVSVSAAPIAGDIFFKNTSAIANNAGPENATQLTSITATTNKSLSTGDYAAIADNTTVTFKDLDWSSLAGSGNIGNLSITNFWSIGGSYTFSLTKITSNSFADETRIIRGEGAVTGPGLDPHTGTFQLSTSGTGTNISFSSTTAVPDSGTTTALLGLSMLGLAGAARRLRK